MCDLLQRRSYNLHFSLTGHGIVVVWKRAPVLWGSESSPLRHLGKTYHDHVHPIADSSKRWHRCKGSQKMTKPTKNHIQGINKPHGADLSKPLHQLGPREHLEKQTNPYFGFLSISRISHEVNITLKVSVMNIYACHLHC